MVEIVRYFYKDREPECVYCGSAEVRRWDHVVPVNKGGDTVLGNMVPACARCDDSKQATEFVEWIDGDAPQSPRNRGVVDTASRILKIQGYVAHYDYKARDLAQRLDENQVHELESIRVQVREAKQRLEHLIAEHRGRG